MGQPLPDELKAFYRIHDGQPDEPVTGLFYGMPFLSLANAAKHWQMWKGIRDGETVVGMAQLSYVLQVRETRDDQRDLHNVGLGSIRI